MTESESTERTPGELKWIDNKSMLSTRPQFEGSSEEITSYRDKLLRGTTKNPLVPLSLLATVTCLTLGLINMKRGDKQKQQIFMRGRVLFQGLALAAMTIGAGLSLRRSTRGSS